MTTPERETTSPEPLARGTPARPFRRPADRRSREGDGVLDPLERLQAEQPAEAAPHAGQVQEARP